LVLSSCAVFAARDTRDVLEIRITHGIEGALPIAIVPFEWSAPDAPPENVSTVIASDLSRSGRFAPMPTADLPARPAEFSAINFKDWRLLGMENLVIGRTLREPDGGFVVEFRLVDVFKAKQIAGYRVPSSAANLRLTAHHISDIIYEALLKVKGAFATRIAYVTVKKTGAGESVYRLQVADADGHNANTILESNQPLLSPAWSPDGSRLAYVSFEEGNSAIYVQHVQTGDRERVAYGRGINSSPSFSPDGRRLAMTLSGDGNPDIYVLDLATKRRQRLTTHPAIDTEATWAPDGRGIAFTSDRGGGPQIYRVDLDGGKPRRVTFGMGDYNTRARFSPDGRKLALVNGGRSGYRIALLDLESTNFELLTDARLDESPSFAPNGSMIIYATMGASGTELAATSVDGRVRQRLAVQTGEVREPAWGPFRN
jgi:TolB protein